MASYPILLRYGVAFFIRVLSVPTRRSSDLLGFAVLCNRWLVQSSLAAFPRCVLCVLCVMGTADLSSSLPWQSPVPAQLSHHLISFLRLSSHHPFPLERRVFQVQSPFHTEPG